MTPSDHPSSAPDRRVRILPETACPQPPYTLQDIQ